MIKRLIAVITVTLGVCFTSLMLLSIWEVGPFNMRGGEGLISSKLQPTLGLLTLSFLILLCVLKLVEKKN
ncbi:MAG: hypothetical protein NTV62_02050 [Candidatus Gribaldobacteria bacterium]|nr:hypothetical protein [Candidatus Gribaldobacteria bacterium]